MAHGTPAAKRERIALDLACGRTIRKTAAAHGTSERTIRRWLADDECFRHQVEQLRGELFSQAHGLLSATARRAAATLRRLLDHERGNVALGAARAVLEIGSRLREMNDLERRLAEVERQLAARAPRAGRVG